MDATLQSSLDITPRRLLIVGGWQQLEDTPYLTYKRVRFAVEFCKESVIRNAYRVHFTVGRFSQVHGVQHHIEILLFAPPIRDSGG